MKTLPKGKTAGPASGESLTVETTTTTTDATPTEATVATVATEYTVAPLQYTGDSPATEATGPAFIVTRTTLVLL